jgi:hypothetical protein
VLHQYDRHPLPGLVVDAGLGWLRDGDEDAGDGDESNESDESDENDESDKSAGNDDDDDDNDKTRQR